LTNCSRGTGRQQSDPPHQSAGYHCPVVASASLRPRRHKPSAGREDVGATEGPERHGATVVRRDRRSQDATVCHRARGLAPDPPLEHHTGPRHRVGRTRGRTRIGSRRRANSLRKPLVRAGRSHWLRESDEGFILRIPGARCSA
jgi:hypothetical protein